MMSFGVGLAIYLGVGALLSYLVAWLDQSLDPEWCAFVGMFWPFTAWFIIPFELYRYVAKKGHEHGQ